MKKYLITTIFSILLVINVLLTGCEKTNNTLKITSNSINIVNITKSDFNIGEETLDEYKINLKIKLPECDCNNGEIKVTWCIKNHPWESIPIIYAGDLGVGINYSYSYNHLYAYCSLLFYSLKPNSQNYDDSFKLKKGDILIITVKCSENSQMIDFTEEIIYNL